MGNNFTSLVTHSTQWRLHTLVHMKLHIIRSQSLFLCRTDENFSAGQLFFIQFHGTATSISLQVLFLWSLITVSDLLHANSLSVCISTSQSIVVWFVFIPLLRHLNIVVLTHLPMYVCWCLVVSLIIVSFCKFLEPVTSAPK